MSILKRVESLRRDYSGEALNESGVNPDPMKQFEIWFEEAVKAEVPDPHAMVLATVSAGGDPSARVVLLRGVDSGGFTFYTNYGSRKASELSANSKAAVVFYWQELDRQIRAEGTVAKTDGDGSDRYFASRPRPSQVAAWASQQSGLLGGRKELEERFAEFQSRFKDLPVPRPENWGGLKLYPRSIEFWQGRPNRLHDRILYVREQDRWVIKRLAP